MSYILYKLKDPESNAILNIINYLDNLNYDLHPCEIIEEDYPDWVTELPSIYDIENETLYRGETNVIQYYTNMTNIIHLKDKSQCPSKRNVWSIDNIFKYFWYK